MPTALTTMGTKYGSLFTSYLTSLRAAIMAAEGQYQSHTTMNLNRPLRFMLQMQYNIGLHLHKWQ